MDFVKPDAQFPENRLRSTIRGMPALGLQGLYLLDDAGNTPDTAWVGSTALDTSGNNRHATFYTGASKIDRITPEGVGTINGANNGMPIVTPISIVSGDPFCGVITLRQHFADTDGPSSGYIKWYCSSAALTTLSSSQPASPGFAIVDDVETGAGEVAPRIFRFICPTQVGGPASPVDLPFTPSIAKSAVATIAFKVDPDAASITIRGGGSSLVILDADYPGVVDAAYLGSTPTHVFGAMKHLTYQPLGRIGLGAFYNYAPSVAFMDRMIVAAKAIKGGS